VEAETASVLIVFPVVTHFQNVSNVEQNSVPVSYTKFEWIQESGRLSIRSEQQRFSLN
jgi:hypothetical protein